MRIAATYFTLSEAGLAQSFLVSEGIEAELMNVESSVNLSGGPPAFQIGVPDVELDRAREILRGLAKAPPQQPPAGAGGDRTEGAVFRAIVRALGVYQLVLAVLDAVTPVLQALGIRGVTPGSPSRVLEFDAWAVIHGVVGLLLLMGAGFLSSALGLGSRGAAASTDGEPPVLKP
jgi:hypothetical protein